MIKKIYKYIGKETIKKSVEFASSGTNIRSIKDLKKWIIKTNQKPDLHGFIVATFVVSKEGEMYIADRHSEHVACAGGRTVLSAGEIFLLDSSLGLEVVEISNQSTGFCPEPESWIRVKKALDLIQISHPERFTTEFIFRRCPVCDQLNIVKNELFFCSVCNAELPLEWNCDKHQQFQEE